jgi:transcriptional regulator with XRE-family HTH domain
MPRGLPRLRAKDGKHNVVGERVRQRREEQKLSQDALCARLADVTGGEWIPDRRDVYRIEDGRRSVYDVEVIALAEALRCSVPWLMTGN